MFENEARMEGVQGRFPYDDLHLHDTCSHAAVSKLSDFINILNSHDILIVITVVAELGEALHLTKHALKKRRT